MTEKASPAKPQEVVVLSNDQDGIWVKRKGRLHSDWSIDTKDGRSYVASRDSITFWPTIGRQLGVTKGVKACVIVERERALPLIFQEDGYAYDKSADLAAFKRMKLAQQLVSAASKENNQDTLKWLIVAGLAVTGVVAILLIYLISKILPALAHH